MSKQPVHAWRVKRGSRLLPDKLSRAAAEALAERLLDGGAKSATVCVQFSSGSIEERLIIQPLQSYESDVTIDAAQPRSRPSVLAG